MCIRDSYNSNRNSTLRTNGMKKEEEYTWEQREKDDKYIMERMHPAVLIPGVFIGVMVIVGCIFKGMMAW